MHVSLLRLLDGIYKQIIKSASHLEVHWGLMFLSRQGLFFLSDLSGTTTWIHMYTGHNKHAP